MGREEDEAAVAEENFKAATSPWEAVNVLPEPPTQETAEQ